VRVPVAGGAAAALHGAARSETFSQSCRQDCRSAAGPAGRAGRAAAERRAK
jgi:hypothetical protein